MNRIFALLIAATALPVLALAGLLGGAEVVDRLGLEIDAGFEQARRGAPSSLWSRPFRLRRGDRPERIDLAGHLARTGYRAVEGEPTRPGEYTCSGKTQCQGATSWTVLRRPFATPEGQSPGGPLRIELDGRGRITALRDSSGQRQASVELEPVRLAVLAGAAARDRESMALAELPAHLIDAVLAVEDQRFFDHHGLDPQRIVGAFTANLRAGRVVQGGSTITQQLVKNLFLGRERTFSRKLREALLAVSLERRRSKPEILEAYLNEVYLGQDGALGIHGVARAAQHYFAKSVTELGVGEGAFLAGLLRGPSLYAPDRRPEAARERRDFVLGLLRDAGHLDAEAFELARGAPLGVVPRVAPQRSTAWFVAALDDELAGLAVSEELDLLHDGLRLHASLDPRLQSLAEGAVVRGVEALEAGQPKLRREDSPLQAALVALDPRSGEILALVGGRNYARSQFDRATQARRQPGSVFKPVVALAALARQERLTPPFTLASVLRDEPISLLSLEGEWQPANHDGEFRGEVTLREAIEHSLNVPMAQLGSELGLRRIIATARRMGIESRLRSVPSLPLGVFEMSLLEITRAYGVLAAGGLRAEAHGLRSVDDAARELHWSHSTRPSRAFREAETYLVTSALEGVVDRGTGASLRRLGFRGPVAGKTGTTDDYRDGWFVGYTPELVVGVWVGFDDGASLHASGSRTALPIFADFLVDALGARGGRDFPRPEGIETIEVVAEAGHRAGVRCAGAPEVFLEGSGPDVRERCGLSRWLARRFGRDEPGTRTERVGTRRLLPPGLRLRFGR